VCPIAMRHWLVLLTLAMQVLMISSPASAQQSLCAKVQMQILQSATVERQAFDALLRVSNGFPEMTLEDVRVEVIFTDIVGKTVLASSNPDDTNASFFIRVSSMSGISDIDGTGTVAGNSSAEVHWLIIPAQGAAKGAELGTMYYVGALLSYRVWPLLGSLASEASQRGGGR